MHGRQWSDGLHQSVEAKESVRVKEETQTLATITIQNFFKLYAARRGMTGTAMTEADEFDKIYKLDVVEIPTNRPVNRVDHNDKMYRDVEQKYDAIVEEIHEVHRRGRPADPFLLADVFNALQAHPRRRQRQGHDASIDEAAASSSTRPSAATQKVIAFMVETLRRGDGRSGPRPAGPGRHHQRRELREALAACSTRRYGIEHEVLNAKNHAREAEIVAKAGHPLAARARQRQDAARQRDHRHEHGRSRHGHQARAGRGLREVQGAATALPERRPAQRPLLPAGRHQVLHPLRRIRSGDQLRPLLQAQARPALPGAGPQGLHAQRALRSAHHRHRAARGPAHRQPASRPVRPAGRPRLVAVLPVAAGRSAQAVHVRLDAAR